MKNTQMTKTVLGFVSSALALALLFVAWVYPEVPTASWTMGGLLIVSLGALAFVHQKALKEAAKTRSVRYGANAALTAVLTLGILAVLNFVNANHFFRKDLTKDQIYGLSDQSKKILAGLQKEVNVTVFTKVQDRDAAKSVLDNYVYVAGSKFKVEYVDPDRDPARAKSVNVKKYGTVLLNVDKKETRVEEVTEEKITNGLIKLLKEKNVTICVLSGHGEKSLDDAGAEGFSQIKQEMTGQTYDVKTVSLLEETKVPEACTALIVMGPTKAFFEKEVGILREWLKNGGRALFGLDPNVRGGGTDWHPEMTKLLGEWFIEIHKDLVIDPTSRLLGVNASVPVVAQYNDDHAITKGFKVTTLFPLASTLDIAKGAPATLKTFWLAKTTPRAFSKSDLKEIATGQVRLDEKKDKPGPHTMMVAVEGTLDDKTKSQARIVAMSTSNVAVNGYARYGANTDLFMNAVSWLVNDENLISIRPKEAGTTMPSLTQTEGRYIQLLTMILIPGGILLLGLIMWIRRKRL